MLLKIEKDRLTLDGEEFYLACGDFQYFRSLPCDWKSRLESMKDFGLTAVQTYCAWNLHEKNEGEFDFSGMLDLGKFLALCDEVGMKVLLRPSPYICGEWDFGGLPWWLLKDRHTRVRCSDPVFFEKVSAYYKRLCEEFVPYLSTNGGPVIAVCVENEYGTFASDLDYLRFLADELRKNGVDVPLYQTDCTEQGIRATRPLGIWQATNYRIESETAVPKLREIQPDMPPFVGEYWSGRAVYWGESGTGRDVKSVAAGYRKALDLGAYLSFYMFTGGTNFGFMNGSRVTKPFDGRGESVFRAITTSYDCDGLISEDGTLTEKYYACRKELDEYLGKPVRNYRLSDPEFQETECRLTGFAPLFENLGRLSKPVKAPEPLTFEELGCPFGFVLYRAGLPALFDRELPIVIKDVRDRAMVFVDGEFMGTFTRDRALPAIKRRADKPHRLDILVENLGRVNSRPFFGEEKGIGDVNYGVAKVSGFECFPLGLDNIGALSYEPLGAASGIACPTFLRGRFSAKPGVPTHLDTRGFGKGVAFVNGFNLGRYWEIGPQQTLYIPGELLREENELVIFELEHAKSDVKFIKTAVMDEFHPELV